MLPTRQLSYPAAIKPLSEHNTQSHPERRLSTLPISQCVSIQTVLANQANSPYKHPGVQIQLFSEGKRKVHC